MKIGTFINHGTIIEIENVQSMNLSVDRGQVRIGDKSLEEFVRTASATDGLLSPQSTESSTESFSSSDDALQNDKNEGEEGNLCDTPCNSVVNKNNCPFTEAQQKASGIKMQAGVALALMRDMQPRFTQKVDWLSPYSVLLRRRWVDGNVSAWCHMVDELFGIKLDARTLSTDLKNLGSPDYTQWTDADRRILRRKQLATDFDTRLTEYFEQKRAEVLKDVRK